ncbi:MAG: penicillin-binding protein [Thermoleophilaceae bacterium]|jgi:penicillin-binding protein 1A|nr:penicillin-binding protein [Thermoleophilaceae bacterium]
MTYRQRKERKRRSKGRIGSRLLLAFAVVLTVLLIGAASVVGYIASIAASAPNINDLKPIDKGSVSEIFAADGSRLGYVQSSEIRTPIQWEDMPVELRQATVAIEDKRFYEHHGVDYEGVVRAGWKNITSGKTVQGGSTITQQLVRALYIKDPKRDFKRKIREAKMASELEQQHSKRWILENYLNDVPYGTVQGRTAIGIEAAALTYFGRHAKDLTLVQSALIAGLPQAPSQYNPFQNERAALHRRNEVLQAMADNGYITQAEAAVATTKPIKLHPTHRFSKRREPYFFDYVQEQLIQKYGVGVYRKGGLKIYTTIDPKLQEEGRRAIQGRLYLKSDPSSAIVTIDPDTGYIKAMASSGGYRDRTFNLAAQGHRQPGSSFKPFVLMTAVLQGADPDRTIYVSKPVNLQIPGYGTWSPKTYSNTYSGAETLTQATLHSDNSVYAQLDLDVGPDKVADTAKLMGIQSKLEGLPSEGLGGLTYGVSPLEMASAYATLASGGIRSEPKAIRKVVFPDGKSDDLGKPKRKRVFSDGEAYAVTRVLEKNVQAGTGTAANIGCPAAGKTGTTDNFADAWFVGFTPHLSTSVWVGYPNSRVEMTNVHGISVAGGTFPAEIWHDYMNVAHGTDCDSFPQPTQPAHFSPFYGDHSANGKRGSGGYYGGGTAYPGGAGGTSQPGGTNGNGNGGYDPNLYAAPPQAAPQTQPPPSTGGNGGGNGGGTGGTGGGTGGNGAPHP